MSLQLVEILKIQKELLSLPRSKERFDVYLKTMTGGTDDLMIPIGSFNPMSKEHVSSVIDQLTELRAEAILASVLRDFNSKELGFKEDFKVALVVVDDVKGGWTCRESIELERLTKISEELKRKWITVLWWCGDSCTPELIRREMVSQTFKSLQILQKGPIKTLKNWVELEAQAMRAARVELESKNYEWLPKFKSLLSLSDVPTLISAIFGDAAAEKLGYEKLGFPKDAGKLVAQVQDIT
ncbi:MAG: hypothetical protein AB7H97_12725 [Pseudobdellovibrionaceae bacterium]